MGAPSPPATPRDPEVPPPVASAPWWEAPWYGPLIDVLGRGVDPEHGDWLGLLNAESQARGICNAAGQPVSFEASAAMAAADYESAIARSGVVPTRTEGDGRWHDFFNALAWLTYPAIKGQLNRLHVDALRTSAVRGPVQPGRRSRLRDLLTLFDEGAAIVVVSDPEFAHRLRTHDWREVFVHRRDAWHRGVRVHLVGHAVMQKLRRPYKAVCAHACVVLDPALAATGDRALLDRRVADGLRESALMPGDLTPLPVLGVPGWWPGNERPDFYDDAAVFRPLRPFFARSGIASADRDGSS